MGCIRVGGPLGVPLCAISEVDVQQQQSHASQQHDIGNIEDPWKELSVAAGPRPPKWEVPIWEHVKEITHSAKYESVVEVS
jgi:hypothetical protein